MGLAGGDFGLRSFVEVRSTRYKGSSRRFDVAGFAGRSENCNYDPKVVTVRVLILSMEWIGVLWFSSLLDT